MMILDPNSISNFHPEPLQNLKTYKVLWWLFGDYVRTQIELLYIDKKKFGSSVLLKEKDEAAQN